MRLLWLALLPACDDTTFKSHFETVDGEGIEGVVQVFDGNCVDCHTGPNASGGVALDGEFCDSLIDVEAQSGAGTLVVPGDREASVLYQRIVDAARPMPPTGLMPTSNSDLVGQWIDDGADCSGLEPGGGDDGAGNGDGPDAAALGVLSSGCAGCHGGNRPSGGFGVDVDLCDQLVNQVGSSGSILVVPFDADGSLLVQRMLDEAAPMPPNGLLGEDQVDIVKDWINAGAECEDTSSDSDDGGSDDEATDGSGDDTTGGSDDDTTGGSEGGETGGSGDDGGSSTDTGSAVSVTFDDVYLILASESTHCTACHDNTSPSAGLSFYTKEEAYTNLLADGPLGPLVIPGDSEGSALVPMMRGDDGYKPMPPIDDYPEYSLVPPAILGIVVEWIDGGAVL